MEPYPNHREPKPVNHGFFVFVFIVTLVGALLVLISGCASTGLTRYTESQWEQGPDGQMYEDTFTAEARSKAGLFGQVPEAVHDINTQWGGANGEPNFLRVGQSAKLDNTAQADVAMFYGQMLAGMFQQLLQSSLATPQGIQALGSVLAPPAPLPPATVPVPSTQAVSP